MPKYVFNPESLIYEPAQEPRYKHLLRIALGVLVAAGLCMLYFWIYTSVLGWDLPKTISLKRENAEWQSRIDLVNRQLDRYGTTIEMVEERDVNVYRTIYGLAALPSPPAFPESRYASLVQDGADARLRSTLYRLDDLSARTVTQSKALDEVSGLARNAGDMVSHIPMVPPLLPDKNQVNIASPFGYRTDPVYGGTRFHSGQDLATRQGYPVYATGDGVVELTDFKFDGYGNEIVIDHGFGYKTRFAHLSRIDVAPGMQLHRGDLIGAVGATGKATGPHLHYEVIYMGSPVNPYGFMDMDMPLDEYRAMIDKRSEENSPRQKTSLELLRERTGK